MYDCVKCKITYIFEPKSQICNEIICGVCECMYVWTDTDTDAGHDTDTPKWLII